MANEMDEEILDQLRRQADQRRKHATFFAWHDRSADGKGVAETGVVRTLLEAMAEDGSADYRDPKPSGEQWPDCWAVAADGTETAFEVSELVDPPALPAGTPRPWEPAMVQARLQAIISEKDQRSSSGRGARNVVLVIHTDEMYLNRVTVASALADHAFTLPHRNLARAILLFSYDPHCQGYPFIELRLSNRGHR